MSRRSPAVVFSGLGTFSTTMTTAATYDCIVSLTLPGISKGDTANSSVVFVIKQNGSTIYTSNAGDEGTRIRIIVAASDTISITTSSSAAVDKRTNAIQGVMVLG